jgi:hypothetical protein
LPANNPFAQFEKARSRAAYFSNSEKIAAQLPGFFRWQMAARLREQYIF